MKGRNRSAPDEMRPEYRLDYSTAVRGKYHGRLLKEGANVVVLEPDIARAFRNSAAVNAALRSLLQILEATRRLRKGTGRPSHAARAPRRNAERRAVHR